MVAASVCTGEMVISADRVHLPKGKKHVNQEKKNPC
jgi:hypothetical protein